MIIDLQEYRGFKVGMRVKILGYPDAWSSGLNSHCPNEIKYPYSCIIEKMSYNEEMKCYSMTDGKYGFEIKILIKRNFITSTILDRQKKLKKINAKYLGIS